MKKTSFGPNARYATALFELAQEKGVSAMVSQVESLKNALETSDALKATIESAAVSAEEKKAVLVDLLNASGADAILVNFVSVVADNKRADALAGILAAYLALEAEARGEVSATVVSAHPLTDAQAEQVKSFVMKKQPQAQSVVLDTDVDESLIAGMKIRVGSTEFDTTVRGRLDGLRTTLN